MDHYFSYLKHVEYNLVNILPTVISIVFQSIFIIDILLTLLLYCNIITEGSVFEVTHKNNVPHIVKGNDLETLTVAPMQTLKPNNKICGKEEVFHLVQESVESEVTKEIFEERLDALVESHSVKIKLPETRTLSLRKSNQDYNIKESID